MRAIGAGGFRPTAIPAAREAASLCCRQTVLPLSRALHLLQYFGHFSPSVLPAALASFHSAAHLRWPSRAAIWLTVGSRFAAPSRFLDLRLPVSSPSAGVDACARRSRRRLGPAYLWRRQAPRARKPAVSRRCRSGDS